MTINMILTSEDTTKVIRVTMMLNRGALLWTIFFLTFRYVSNHSQALRKMYNFRPFKDQVRGLRGNVLFKHDSYGGLYLKSQVSPLRNATTDTNYDGSKEDAAFLLSPASNATNANATPVRLNVVDEIPTLDVGPLDMMSVEVNSSAVLKCAHKSLIIGDTVRLILWYRNDTRRPIISFDARKEASKNSKSDHHFADYEDEVELDNSTKLRELNKVSAALFPQMEKASYRIVLGKEGDSLVLRNVAYGDQAEYRCKVHYKTSPSFTYRLQLVVVGAIRDMQLLNQSNLVIPSEIGPFKDGEIHLFHCQVKYDSKFKSLDWILNGKTLPSTLQTRNETIVLTLELHLCQSYAYRMLYCRLSKENPNGKGYLIREKATKIIMYYVPRARLLINTNASEGIQTWPEAAKGDAKVEIGEGQDVVFSCKIRARPPPYNITWLKNGQHVVLSKKRTFIQNSSLTIKEVRRRDDGLYTCLASNSEGDGQSNAVLLRIHYSPRCSIRRDFPLIVARNISISLECNFEAEPDNVTFTWHRMKIVRGNSSSKNQRNNMNGHGGVITGEFPSSSPFPKLIDLTPEKEEQTDEEGKEGEVNPSLVEGPSLPFERDPKDPTRSFLRIMPQVDPEGYVCYAKNNIGHSRVPCVFRLDVVDPPSKPQGCKIEASSMSSLNVSCIVITTRENMLLGHQSPDISPVRALETRTSTVLEVWALGTLVANLTSEKASWNVRGLTPDTDLRLRIYTTSLNAHSIPVTLLARTKNSYQEASTVTTAVEGFAEDHDADNWSADDSLRIWIIIGVGLGIFSLLVLCVLGWFYVIKGIQKRKQRSSERNKTNNKKGFNDSWSDPSSSSQPTAIPSPNIQMLENPSSQLERSIS